MPALPVKVFASEIASAVDVGGARQRQLLDGLPAESEAHRAPNGVGALAGGLDDDIAGIVDPIGVVARAADHPVGIAAAIEDIVAGVAGQDVGQAIAGAVDVGGARQRQVLDGLPAEAEAHRALNRVGALACGLDDDVAGIVDPVGVVARTADHPVVFGTAVEDIVAGIAGQGVCQRIAGAVDVGGARQRQHLDGLPAESEAHRALNRVGALAGGLDDDVAGIVDPVGVVARAADHAIVFGTARRGHCCRRCRSRCLPANCQCR